MALDIKSGGPIIWGPWMSGQHGTVIRVTSDKILQLRICINNTFIFYKSDSFIIHTLCTKSGNFSSLSIILTATAWTPAIIKHTDNYLLTGGVISLRSGGGGNKKRESERLIQTRSWRRAADKRAEVSPRGSPENRLISTCAATADIIYSTLFAPGEQGG